MGKANSRPKPRRNLHKFKVIKDAHILTLDTPDRYGESIDGETVVIPTYTVNVRRGDKIVGIAGLKRMGNEVHASLIFKPSVRVAGLYPSIDAAFDASKEVKDGIFHGVHIHGVILSESPNSESTIKPLSKPIKRTQRAK